MHVSFIYAQKISFTHRYWNRPIAARLPCNRLCFHLRTAQGSRFPGERHIKGMMQPGERLIFCPMY